MVESIKELRKICQESVLKITDRWYINNVTRKVSIYITKLFLYTSIRPNQVTLIAILIGIIAGIFFLSGKESYSITGAFVLQLWLIFDCVDGEIARYKKQESMSGSYLDLVLDGFLESYIFVCIAFGVYSVFHKAAIFVFGFSSVLFMRLITLAMKEGISHVVLEKHKRSSQNGIVAQKPAAVKTVRTEGSKISFMKKTYWFAYCFLFRYPAIMNIVLIAAVIDIFLPAVKIGHYAFSCMSGLLVFYGIAMPLFWSVTVIYVVLAKKVEKDYQNIFGDTE